MATVGFNEPIVQVHVHQDAKPQSYFSYFYDQVSNIQRDSG